MQLCDSGHDLICFEGKNCPFCEEIERMESRIEELEDEFAELEAKRSN